MTFVSGLNNRGQVAGVRDDGMGLVWRNELTTPIGSLGGGYSRPADINDLGMVVGESSTATGQTHAFLWQRGVMVDLGTLGGPDSSAYAVNDRGDVVGVSTTGDGTSAYFRWRRGVLTRISTPGDLGVFPSVMINNSGLVAGTYESAEPPAPGSQPASRIWLWDDGTLTDVGAAGGHDARPHGLNDRGQIVGLDLSPSGEAHIFSWYRGVRTDIGETNPWSGSSINNHGQVAFTGRGPDGDQAYLWRRGVLTNLGDLGGGPSTTADINERGDVTGMSLSPSGNRGFVWRRGTMSALDVLGSDEASQGSFMNDEGLVVGVSASMFGIQWAAWSTHGRG